MFKLSTVAIAIALVSTASASFAATKDTMTLPDGSTVVFVNQKKGGFIAPSQAASMVFQCDASNRKCSPIGLPSFANGRSFVETVITPIIGAGSIVGAAAALRPARNTTNVSNTSTSAGSTANSSATANPVTTSYGGSAVANPMALGGSSTANTPQVGGLQTPKSSTSCPLGTFWGGSECLTIPPSEPFVLAAGQASSLPLPTPGPVCLSGVLEGGSCKQDEGPGFLPSGWLEQYSSSALSPLPPLEPTGPTYTVTSDACPPNTTQVALGKCNK